MKKSKIKVLISAGPTREAIDPVRFISNYSTGTFGFEIARQAKRRGHQVTLVSGVTCLKGPVGVKIRKVGTALEMQKAICEEIKDNNCLIMNAAVCDYRPLKFFKRKIKKSKKAFNIKLIENPDILKGLGRFKENRLLVGFAVETENVLKGGLAKLKEKNLDLIVAAKISKFHSPFGSAKISAYIIEKQGKYQKITNATKPEFSRKLLDRVEGLWYTIFQSKQGR